MSKIVPLNGFGGGASNPLNFKIVSGLEQPTNPTENMIWVNTDVEIQNYEFSGRNPFIKTRYENLIDIQNLGDGWLNTNGSVGGLTSENPELHTNSYIPVTYGKQYQYNYHFSETKEMWMAIYEFTGSYTGKQTIVVVDFVNSDYQTGIYTPSSSDVTAVKMAWRTFSGVEHSVEFNDMIEYIDCENGCVWISTDVSGSVEFNALKKNGIHVCPISVKQYIGGAWVGKTAKSYQGDKWVDWVPYLYNAGDECTDITGGFSFDADDGGIGNKQTDRLVLSAYATNGSGSIVMAVTNNKIDLSKFSTLHCKVEAIKYGKLSSSNLGNITMSITTTKQRVLDDIVAEAKVESGNQHELILDLTSIKNQLSSPLYVKVWAWVSNCEVTEIWME